MPEITLYRVVFILTLLVGIAFPLATAVRVALIYASTYGLSMDQWIRQQERLFNEQQKVDPQQEQQTGPPVIKPPPDLTRPAFPNEGV